MSSVRVQVGSYVVQLWRGEAPASLETLVTAAELSEHFDDGLLDNGLPGEFLAVSISENGAGSLSALLFTTQRYQPSVAGFDPGVLIVPETGVAFIGAGTRLLAYDLHPADSRGAARMWEDAADVGFWWWDREGDIILMAAELELAAWNTAGHKLWTTFVEPPWFYSVTDDILHLNVMDFETKFAVRAGPGGS
ncbi:hypothetical protein MF271_14575 [Deinococcus sp. KNUC1210]|uniref:hypothetical protein n=1 Tax=Deinococcus sp. KNUC1210 TaxID=2917691 RepID=UPI001EF12171|nr:hypothetical protein [Deinococcus sp. KNUC1210]ULH15165.1 hypothetical protein MF271_14575 [Deinococcus sp. KNUC1210]